LPAGRPASSSSPVVTFAIKVLARAIHQPPATGRAEDSGRVDKGGGETLAWANPAPPTRGRGPRPGPCPRDRPRRPTVPGHSDGMQVAQRTFGNLRLVEDTATQDPRSCEAAKT
jgi:hypothetical protein